MDKATDPAGLARMVERRLSQLKVTAKLLSHEIELASGEKTLSLDRDLAESILTTLELFIEDAESARKGAAGPIRKEPEKPQVTRLN